MIKRIAQLLSFTWLFWLYLSPQLLPLPEKTTFNRKGSYATLQPVKGSTDAVISLAQASIVAIRRTSSPMLALDRLEISLSQRQVTLYRDNILSKRYPVAIGRTGWETPTGTFKIRQMQENPIWINPLTNAVIPADEPSNPLGEYWIGFWTDGHNWIGFHGTPETNSVGQAISHGCVRMYNDDIRELFYRVSPGMPVIVKR